MKQAYDNQPVQLEDTFEEFSVMCADGLAVVALPVVYSLSQVNTT